MRISPSLADRMTAAVLLCLGAAMLYGGFVMDRLEIRQIHPASIPGLLPMMLGAVLMICAVLLFLSTRGENAPSTFESSGSFTNLLIAAGWSSLFAIALVGRLPFAVATGVYIAGFALWFGWPSEPAARIRWTVFSLVFAAVMAGSISALFRYGFLVRLP